MPRRTLAYVRLDQLVPALANPKAHDQDGLAASFDRFGYIEPIVEDDRTGRLLSGHGRLDQLQALYEASHAAPDGIDVDEDGMWLAPVVRGWASTDDDEAQAAVIAVNRLVEKGGWQVETLAEQLEHLLTTPAGLEGTGYTEPDLAALLASLAPPQETPGLGDPDEIPAVPDVPVTKPGDLWILGDHRLICGDCTDPAVVAAVLGGDRATAMVTDPPYQVGYDAGNHPASQANQGAANRNKEWASYQETAVNDDLYERFLAVALDLALIDTAPIYQWHGGTRACAVTTAWEANGVLVHQQIIWVKARKVLTYADLMLQHECAYMGWKQGHRPDTERRAPVNETTVWEHDQVGETGAGHPTQKPSALYLKPYAWHCRRGEVVYEPFSGSGTAIAAAEVAGLRCRAVEVAPEFVDVACRRWQRLTGRVPVLEATGQPHDFTT